MPLPAPENGRCDRRDNCTDASRNEGDKPSRKTAKQEATSTRYERKRGGKDERESGSGEDNRNRSYRLGLNWRCDFHDGEAANDEAQAQPPEAGVACNNGL